MKKNLVIILVAVIIVIGGVVFISSKSKQGEEIISPTQLAEESMLDEESISSEESQINSLDSLSLEGSYQCVYTIEEGLKVITYVKNGKMRTEITLEGGDTNISLYADNKVYQWSDKEKQGIFMSVEEAKNQQGTEIENPDEYLKEIKVKYQPDCKNIDLDDSLFIAPKDVRFQDLSQLLNQ